jgi:hypothetical protein
MMTLPSVEAELAVFGLLIHIEFKPQAVMLILAAGFAAAGSEWLINAEEKPSPRKPAVEHWVIPSFAAIAIGFVVMRIPSGPQLLLGLIMGAMILVIVLSAEFIVALEGDPRLNNIAIALGGLSFLLMTGAFYAIYDTGIRAIFAIPLVLAISSIISWRLLRLSFPDLSVWTWAGLVGLLSSQLAIGIHYLPLSPLTNSVLLGVLTYVGYGLILTHLERSITRKHIIESAAIVIISIVLIFVVN